MFKNIEYKGERNQYFYLEKNNKINHYLSMLIFFFSSFESFICTF